MLPVDRFSSIPRGKIAAVATVLEMRSRPDPRIAPADLPGELVPIPAPDTEWYLALYRRIGAAHLWFSRLYMAQDELARVLGDPATQVFTWRVESRDEGILELDFSDPKACEIKYFGVAPSLQGTGVARAMMNTAIDHAFRQGVSRLWLHTNTIDHPKAMSFYRRSGFEPVSQEIEIADDPRLRGVLPRDAAPHVPIFE